MEKKQLLSTVVERSLVLLILTYLCDCDRFHSVPEELVVPCSTSVFSEAMKD